MHAAAAAGNARVDALVGRELGEKVAELAEELDAAAVLHVAAVRERVHAHALAAALHSALEELVELHRGGGFWRLNDACGVRAAGQRVQRHARTLGGIEAAHRHPMRALQAARAMGAERAPCDAHAHSEPLTGCAKPRQPLAERPCVEVGGSRSKCSEKTLTVNHASRADLIEARVHAAVRAQADAVQRAALKGGRDVLPAVALEEAAIL